MKAVLFCDHGNNRNSFKLNDCNIFQAGIVGIMQEAKLSRKKYTDLEGNTKLDDSSALDRTFQHFFS